MSRNWVLDVQPDPSNPPSIVLHLGMEDSRSGNVTELLPPCRSIDELRSGIDEVKGELDNLLAEAQRRFELVRKGVAGFEGPVPEKVWKEMESMGLQEQMFEYFNSFSEAERQQIAEYIFSHANMFKGRGPVFSEHYDTSSYTLE
jgi:hypothetical protein